MTDFASANANSGANVRADIYDIDPVRARVILSGWHFERQRPIVNSNTDRLAYEMAAARFVQGTPLFVCQLPDGTRKLVNGYHTLHGVIKSKTTQRLTFITLAVADMEEASAVYASFDIHRPRTWLDGMRAVGMAEDIPLLRPSMAALAVLMQAFNHDRGTRPALQSRAVRHQWLERYRKEIGLYAAAVACAPQTTRHLFQRGGIMAVGLECFRYQPSFADEFWHAMAADDGLKVGDPRKTLLRWMGVNKVAATGADTNVQARAAALAWNAAFRGKDLSLLKPATMAGITILGTPWVDGRGPGEAVKGDKAPTPRPPAGGAAGGDLFDGAGA
jgi:hypothetical protein